MCRTTQRHIPADGNRVCKSNISIELYRKLDIQKVMVKCAVQSCHCWGLPSLSDGIAAHFLSAFPCHTVEKKFGSTMCSKGKYMHRPK